MTLIELLESLTEYQDENTKAVFLQKNPSKEPEKISHEQKLEFVKNVNVILSDKPNLFDISGVFVGSTAYLLRGIQECKITDINAEFEGLCMYFDW